MLVLDRDIPSFFLLMQKEGLPVLHQFDPFDGSEPVLGQIFKMIIAGSDVCHQFLIAGKPGKDHIVHHIKDGLVVKQRNALFDPLFFTKQCELRKLRNALFILLIIGGKGQWRIQHRFFRLFCFCHLGLGQLIEQLIGKKVHQKLRRNDLRTVKLPKKRNDGPVLGICHKRRRQSRAGHIQTVIGLKDHRRVITGHQFRSLRDRRSRRRIAHEIHDHDGAGGFRGKEGNIQHVDKLCMVPIQNVIDPVDIFSRLTRKDLGDGRADIRSVIIHVPAGIIESGKLYDLLLNICFGPVIKIQLLRLFPVHSPLAPLLPLPVPHSDKTGIPCCLLYSY